MVYLIDYTRTIVLAYVTVLAHSRSISDVSSIINDEYSILKTNYLECVNSQRVFCKQIPIDTCV